MIDGLDWQLPWSEYSFMYHAESILALCRWVIKDCFMGMENIKEVKVCEVVSAMWKWHLVALVLWSHIWCLYIAEHLLVDIYRYLEISPMTLWFFFTLLHVSLVALLIEHNLLKRHPILLELKPLPMWYQC